MKIFLIILLMPLLGLSQEFTGAWGLTWKMSSTQVINNIKAEKKYFPNQITLDRLIYKQVNFAGQTADSIYLNFYKDSLCSFYIWFTPTDEMLFFDYKNLTNTLTEKYASPQVDKEEFRQPYSKSDPIEKRLEAIYKGYGHFESEWKFFTTDTSKCVSCRGIKIKIDPKIYRIPGSKNYRILLEYNDGYNSNKQILESLQSAYDLMQDSKKKIKKDL